MIRYGLILFNLGLVAAIAVLGVALLIKQAIQAIG